MKFNKRDFAGAQAKIDSAGLTDRQLAAFKDRIIGDAVCEAERRVLEDSGTQYRLVGSGSITTHAGTLADSTELVRILAYWYHEHHKHLVLA